MSSTQLTSLICNHFGGIRRKQSSFSDEQITCSDCQNVELFFTGLNSGVGVRVAKGNSAQHTFSHTETINGVETVVIEEVIGLFESNQNGETVLFAYTEDSNRGYLYSANSIFGSYTLINRTLTKTGRACGVDFKQGLYDFFVFSNGKEIVYLYTDTNPTSSHTLTLLNPQDPDYANYFYNGLPKDVEFDADTNHSVVSGLGMVVFDNRLWIFNKHNLFYSYYGNCIDFSTTDPQIPASAGFIPFTKDITAIAEYLGSLAVFHRDSSALVTQDATTIYAVGDESPGGCAGYDALIFHGTDLYFYDNTKKGVFSFQQIVNGDKTLSQNIAEDLQDELLLISDSMSYKIRTKSVITEDRNEIWFIIPTSTISDRTLILIFDYLRGEWVKRYSNKINCLLVHNADLYSGGAKLYKEYETNKFDGEFIEAFYKCSIFNYGVDNTLKITKFPPRITIDIGDTCDFWVEYVRNYNTNKNPKIKNIKAKTVGKLLIFDNDLHFDDGYSFNTSVNTVVKMPSTTFKTLEITFKITGKNSLNETIEQGFCIKNIEFSKLKIKQV